MNLGLSVAAFTTLHVLISLVGIGSGVVFFAALLRHQWLSTWNLVFLVTTVATSATGFLFVSKSFGPPHVIGLLSLIILAVAIFALYGRRLTGPWRKLYLGTSLFALYLNLFVGVVQAFQKLPPLHALAPTQSEAPFIVAQTLLLVVCVATGFFTMRDSALSPRPDTRVGIPT
jgi:hypothetical protein